MSGSSSQDPPLLDLSPEQLVWVTEGTTQHPANFIAWDKDGGGALIRWETAGWQELIQDTSTIAVALPPRRRQTTNRKAISNSSNNKRTCDGKIKNEDDAAAAAEDMKPPFMVGSSSTAAAVTPDPQIKNEYNADAAEDVKPPALPVGSSSTAAVVTPGPQIKNEYNDAAAEDVKPPFMVGSSSTAAAVTPDPPASSDPAPSPSASLLPLAVIQSLEADGLDIKVKKEGDRVVLNSNQRKELQAKKEAMIQANKGPDGKPRRVFRRGCHAQCITTVLGGCGTDCWPAVMNVPQAGTTFIEPGEFYVAGIEAWNSFGPQYPGATAFVNSEAFDQNPDQDTFHYFVQCSKKKTQKFWHGRDAKEGYHYMGVYRKAARSEDEIEMEVRTIVKYVDLPFEYQESLADFFLDRPKQGVCMQYQSSKDKEDYMHAAKELYDEDEWKGMPEKRRETLAMLQYLVATEFKFDLTPVESVGYDENLYQALIECGAAKVNNTQNGYVSVDPTELGFPANV